MAEGGHHSGSIKKARIMNKNKIGSKKDRQNVVLGQTHINSLIGNHVITDELFKYLTLGEMKNSRLVSKLWDEKICENFRRSRWEDFKMIEFTQENQFDEFQNVIKNARVRFLCQFYASLDSFLNFGREFFEILEPKMLKVGFYPGLSSAERIFNLNEYLIRKKLLTLLQWSSGSLREVHIEVEVSRHVFMFPTLINKYMGLRVFENFDLPYLEKITITFDGISGQNDSGMMYKIFSGIAKKAPNLKSFKLHEVSCTKTSNFMENFKSCQFLSKLKELSFMNNYSDEGYSTGHLGRKPIDYLRKMYENGLKNLKTFQLQTEFNNYYDPVKLGQDFDLLSKFLRAQSCTQLQSLGLNITLQTGNLRGYKINLPILPKLLQLRLGAQIRDLENIVPFTLMDLSCQFPVLNEISISFYELCQDFKFSSWSSLFSGSCASVQIFRLKLGGIHKAAYSPCYLALEKLFPNVKKFETNDIKHFIRDEGKKPWENTLEIFSIAEIRAHDLANLEFNIFLSFKELQRIELANCYKNSSICTKLDMESLENLKIKSLKIHRILLSSQVVDQIRRKCQLDYTP